MKKAFLISMLAILLFSSAQSTIRRIQYWGTPVAGVDYASGTLAIAASSAGDTILTFNQVTESFTINKQLVFIGPGYWNWSGVDANFNQNLQNIHPPSNTNGNINITFAPGSDGTIITGCLVTFTTSGVTGINNIKIRNCYNTLYSYIGATGSNLIYDNWEFSKCYFDYYIQIGIASNKLTNFKLFNCLCSGTAGTGIIQMSNATGQTGIIENCTFIQAGGSFNLTSNGFIIQNCVFYNGYPAGATNCVFNNNVFTQTPSPAVSGSGNIFNATAANLFVGLPTLGTNSTDGRFALKAGSPAIGGGRC